jgi:hypothetical protein
VPFQEAPAGPETWKLADAIAAFEALAGTWTGTLGCVPDYGGERPITISLTPDKTELTRMITGSTPNSNGAPGRDCAEPGVGLTNCGIEIVDVNIDGLRGQRAVLEAELATGLYRASMYAELDASYDPTLSYVGIKLWLGYDGVFDGTIRFAGQVTRKGGGMNTMSVNDCGIVDLSRVSNLDGTGGGPTGP